MVNISLENKNIVLMGVANQRSIAWSIAQALDKAGANLIFTYTGEKFESTIKELIKTLDVNKNSLVLDCDVSKDESIEKCFNEIGSKFPEIHGIIHSVAFANKDELSGEYLNTTRDGFLLSQNVSAYSLTGVIKAARPYISSGGSIVTLTYYGSEKVVQNYNVMGVAKASLEASVRYLANDLGKDNIRVNAISAGPLRTLSAKGVSDFNSILKEIEVKAPLKRNIEASEVGDTALFLISNLSRGITGEVLHVDSGYHIMG